MFCSNARGRRVKLGLGARPHVQVEVSPVPGLDITKSIRSRAENYTMSRECVLEAMSLLVSATENRFWKSYASFVCEIPPRAAFKMPLENCFWKSYASSVCEIPSRSAFKMPLENCSRKSYAPCVCEIPSRADSSRP
jgi:hypothetical protein